jgi:peroxiredoxin
MRKESIVKNILLSVAAAAIVAFGVAVVFIGAEDKKEDKPREGTTVGSIAPDFTLKDVDDKEVKLSEFKDKSAVLLVFWFVDCPSCRKEVPDLKKYHKDYGEKGLKVLSVNVADKKDKIKKFMKEQGIEYTVLMNPTQDIASKYKVLGVPTNILIDTAGIIRFRDYVVPKEQVIKDWLPKAKDDKKDEKKDDKGDGKKDDK